MEQQLKFKKLDYTIKDKDGVETKHASEGVLPTRSTLYSAGLDLWSTRITNEIDNSGQITLTYHTDIAVEIPEGYVGLLVPKSSVWERSLRLCNCCGIIDSDYRGEIMAKFKITTDAIPTVYQKGEAFAQLIIVPILLLDPIFVDVLSNTERGDKGFGEADKVKEETSND